MNLTFLEGQLPVAYLHEGLIFLGTMGTILCIWSIQLLAKWPKVAMLKKQYGNENMWDKSEYGQILRRAYTHEQPS